MRPQSLQAMPWIGDHSVFDVSNTVALGVGRHRRDVDLLADPDLLQRWRMRVSDPRLAELPHDELLGLRKVVRDALDHAARREVLPLQTRRRLNDLAAGALIALQLDEHGALVEQERSGLVTEVVARRTLSLVAGPEGEHLRRCHARGCGMFFLARRRDQEWCSTSCGNRVRAARRDAPAAAR